MPISFDTQTLTISELFSGNNLYKMPAFQRPYSWNEEQVLQLFDDFHTNYSHQSSFGDSDFFLGPIVVSENNSLEAADVVDGQQRLVTLTFILALLRDLSSDQNFQKSINDFIWCEANTLLNPNDMPRVILREIDQDRMLQWVHQIGGTRNLPVKGDNESTNNLLTNIKAVKNEIGTVNNDYIEGLAKYILNNCYVIKIISKNAIEAYRIFKSINTIGQPLTEIDLIRGELINPQCNSDKEAKELADIWDKIEEELGIQELQKYIKIVLSTIDSDYNTLPLDTAFRKILSDPLQLSDFRRKLSEFVGSYENLKSASLDCGEDSHEINKLIKCTKKSPFDNWYSVSLLWLASQRTGKEMLEFFRALDALCLGLIILKLTAKGKLNKRFSAIEERIKNGDVLTCGQSEIYLSNDEKHKIKVILEKPIKKTEKFIKPLLMRLNVEIQNASLPIYFPEKITLEHILPQKPKPNSYWMEKFPNENKRIDLCNSLGNLTILTHPTNASIKNSEFKDKLVRIFSKEGSEAFALTSELNKYTDWTEDSINQRSSDLINIARKVMMI